MSRHDDLWRHYCPDRVCCVTHVPLKK